MGGGHVPVLKFGGYPVFTQIKPGSCEFHTDNEEVYEMIHEKEIDYISPIEAPRGWSPSKKEISAMVCPPDNAVNEPLGAEEWAAREAAREAVLAPWSKTTAPKTPKKMTALERMVARKRKTAHRATTAAPVTGGGSAAATSSKKKKTPSERLNRKTRKVSRRH